MDQDFGTNATLLIYNFECASTEHGLNILPG
jgi:hypothetical protein